MSVIDEIRNRLGVPAERIELIDGQPPARQLCRSPLGGGHYQLDIDVLPPLLANTVARHRLIYDALGDMMRQEIHATFHQANPGRKLTSNRSCKQGKLMKIVRAVWLCHSRGVRRDPAFAQTAAAVNDAAIL